MTFVVLGLAVLLQFVSVVEVKIVVKEDCLAVEIGLYVAPGVAAVAFD